MNTNHAGALAAFYQHRAVGMSRHEAYREVLMDFTASGREYVERHDAQAFRFARYRANSFRGRVVQANFEASLIALGSIRESKRQAKSAAGGEPAPR